MSPKSDFRCWSKHHGSKKSEDHWPKKNSELDLDPVHFNDFRINASITRNYVNRCEFDFTKVKRNNLRITIYCSCSLSIRQNDISHVESFETVLCGYHKFTNSNFIWWIPNLTQVDASPLSIVHSHSRESVLLFKLIRSLFLLELRIKYGKVQSVQRANCNHIKLGLKWDQL